MNGRIVRLLCALAVGASFCAWPAVSHAQSQAPSSKAEAKKTKKPAKRTTRAAGSRDGSGGARPSGDRSDVGPNPSGMGDRHDARNSY